jgi:hypothetical protein
MFKPVFIKLVKKQPNPWWPIVVDNASKGDMRVPPRFMPSVDVQYQQETGTIISVSCSRCLHLHLHLHCTIVAQEPEHAASHFSTTAPTVQDFPHPKTIQILWDTIIMKYVPEITGAVVFNQNQEKTKTNHL